MPSNPLCAFTALVALTATSCTQVSVDLVPVADVAVLPPQLQTEVSDRVALGTEVRASSGELLSGRRVSWSSTDPTVATVDSLGIVTALAPGQTIIAAEVEGRLGTALILVSAPPPIGPPPSRPTDLKANDDGSTVIQLEWKDNSVNEAGFEVQRRQGKNGDWSLVRVVAANATRHRDAGLEPETEYEYRVRACNAAGCSQYSNRDKTKTGDD
ncbi:MAG: fibronectin type III domain-containing protein [Gemmatimonadota bacterium]|nr:fibronectin type III domain-containing protein [Gemmatimonadota bacterium]